MVSVESAVLETTNVTIAPGTGCPRRVMVADTSTGVPAGAAGGADKVRTSAVLAADNVRLAAAVAAMSLPIVVPLFFLFERRVALGNALTLMPATHMWKYSFWRWHTLPLAQHMPCRQKAMASGSYGEHLVLLTKLALGPMQVMSDWCLPWANIRW